MIIIIAALMACSGAMAASITVTATPITAESLDTTISITIINDDTLSAMENIMISNAYNIIFDTAGVTIDANGGHRTFTAITPLTDQIISDRLSFDITWYQANAEGVSEMKRETVSVRVEQESQANITATRTSSNTQASPGDIVTLTYTVSNTGLVNINSISVTDKEIAGSTPIFKDIALAPGETHTLAYEYKMGYSTVTSAPVVSYKVQGESDARTFNGISAMSLGMVNAKLSVEVQQGESTAEGVTFTINLVNNGNQRIKDIKVKDDEDKSLNSDTFTLAIGESRTLTHTVKTDQERYVVFYITGTTGSDEAYSDKTKSYVVRKYIDPSLLGMEFSCEVLEQLNPEGSITVRFRVNNTGTMDMQQLILSEGEQGELKRIETVPVGETLVDQTVYVGEPRDLVFTLDIADMAGNPYQYTANITADYIGVSTEPGKTTDGAEIEAIGNVGQSVTNTLRAIFIVLIIMTVLAGAALIAVSVLEKKKRQEIARKRAMREKQERQQQRRAELMQASDPAVSTTGAGDTQTRMRPSTQPRRPSGRPTGTTDMGTTRSRTPARRGYDDRPDPKL